MRRMVYASSIKLFLITTLILVSAVASFAQGGAFTYQGRLVTDGSPADGLFEFQFKLFDALTDGNQIGPEIEAQLIQVTNGVFIVELDFGLEPFDGLNRFLEISVGPAGGQRTLLAPRQPIASAPYAVKSFRATFADGLSGTCVNCVTSNQIASVNGSAVNGTIPVASVPAGSGNYIQNATTQQQSSNFNISGSGFIGGNLSVGSESISSFKLQVISPSNSGLRVQTDTPFGTVASFGGFGDFRIDAPGLVGGRLAVKEDGKVGMGILTPAFKLHVIDTGNTGLRVQTNTAGGTVASFASLGEFRIDGGGLAGGRLTVKEDGKVGIGTAIPGEKLSVAGTIQSTSGGFKFPDGSLQTTAAQTSTVGQTYSATRTTPLAVPPVGSASLPIVRVDIPPGSYMVSATVEFVNTANVFLQDNRRTIRCTLRDESWVFALPAATDNVGQAVILNLHSPKTFGVATSLELTCVAQTGGTDQSFVAAQQRRLTATRIGNIVVQ